MVTKLPGAKSTVGGNSENNYFLDMFLRHRKIG